MFTLRIIGFLVEFIFSFIEGLIGLRVLLKFLGASMTAPFVNWVYQTSKPLLVPFEGIFPSSSPGGGFVLEISALFALVVYAVIGYGVHEMLIGLNQIRWEKKLPE